MSTHLVTSKPRTEPGVRRWSLLAWSSCALAQLFLALSALLGYLGRSAELPGWSAWPVPAILDVAFAGAPVLGAFIASRRPRNPYGWLWLGFGLGYALSSFGGSYATYAVAAGPGSLPAPGAVATVLAEAWVLSITTLPLLLLLFPDGRLPSRRWRALAWPTVGVGAVLLILGPLGPGGSGFAPVENPFEVGGSVGPAIDGLVNAGVMAVFVTIALSALSLVFRYRGADGVGRQQIKWFAFAAALFGVHMGAELTGLSAPLSYLASNMLLALNLYLLYAAIAVAMFRYRLYDIDLIINRALVYGTLTACVAAVYVLVVGYLGTLFQTRDSLTVSLLATGVVAVLFQPLRLRLQRGVNRLMYGERDEPYAVLSRLGQELESALAPGAALATVAEMVTAALKVPHAAVELRRDGAFREAAEHGVPEGKATVWPLLHHGEEVGRLLVSPRSPGEVFSATDRKLLQDLARQAGAVAHAARLTAELQRSRERLVAAREEERRRLRRDLHDGLGPALGGLTLGLDAARDTLAEDPEAADALLAALKREAQGAVSGIRRLVYGLRPPALDDLGLIPAIRQQAAKHGRVEDEPANPTDGAPGAEAGRPGGPAFSLDVPRSLPPLPAAVEVAAYGIISEAIANVSRHAGARSCLVRLSLKDPGTLELEVADDGAGIPPDRRAGVGLHSMRERAEELGGTFETGTRPGGGTRLLARLPLTGEG